MATWRWRAIASALLLTPILAAPGHGPIRRQNNDTQSIQVQQLVAGIGYNIIAQNGELSVASAMQGLVTAPTPNAVLFQVAKDDLLGFMSCGMRIRGNNMKMSSVNPQITRGLAQVGSPATLLRHQFNDF
jgi:hypothetical protein